MFLADHDIQHALEWVQAAFPSFTQWAYTNASEDERSLDGFSLWGQWVLQPEEIIVRHFYTIGQHSYWWTSADVGDAHLLDTEECATLEEAIVALKAEMTRLCRALSVA